MFAAVDRDPLKQHSISPLTETHTDASKTRIHSLTVLKKAHMKLHRRTRKGCQSYDTAGVLNASLFDTVDIDG